MEREDQGVLWCRCVVSRRARMIKYPFVNNKRPIERHLMQELEQRVERAVASGRLEEVDALRDGAGSHLLELVAGRVYSHGSLEMLTVFLGRPYYGMPTRGDASVWLNDPVVCAVDAPVAGLERVKLILQHPSYTPSPSAAGQALYCALLYRAYEIARVLLADMRFDPAAHHNAAVVIAFTQAYAVDGFNPNTRDARVFARQLIRDRRVYTSLTDREIDDIHYDEVRGALRSARDTLRRRDEAIRAHMTARILDSRLPAAYIAGFLNDEPKCTCGKCGGRHLSTSTTAAAGSS